MLVNLFSSESSSKPNFVLKLISQDNQNSLKRFSKGKSLQEGRFLLYSKNVLEPKFNKIGWNSLFLRGRLALKPLTMTSTPILGGSDR